MTIDQKDEETNTKTKGADRTVRTDGKDGVHDRWKMGTSKVFVGTGPCILR